MLVQPVVMPGSGAWSWTVLGDDDVPVGPVERFLAYLTDIERSPNTVKAYAHDLKDFWPICQFPHIRHYARRLIMCGGSGGARAGGEVLPVLGGIIVVSEVVEECEQPIRRTVAAGSSWEWCDPGESVFLDRHVGVEIGAARGFDSLVPQPERDHRRVDPVSQQVHGAAVPEDVGGWVPGAQ